MLPHIILLTRKQKSAPLSATWSTGFVGGSSLYPLKASGVVSVTDGTNVLSGLDYGGGTSSGTNMFYLSPSTGYAWAAGTTYPLAANVQVAEFLTPYFYFIGGGTNSTTSYITNGTASSWTAIASTNKGRRQGGLAKIGSTLYAFGGLGMGGDTEGGTNWESYNGSSWINGGSVPTFVANTSNAAKTIGSNIYIISFSVFYKFDGVNFTVLTNPPATARYSANTVLNDRFYIMGGQGISDFAPHALVHSTDANGATWQVETPLPYGRFFGSAITYLNQIFNFAGEGSGPDETSLLQRTIYRNNQT
jgi:hypothetical protein